MGSRGFPDPEELLLGGRLLPVTGGVAFVAGAMNEVIRAVAARQWVAVWSAGQGDSLEDVLLRLEPLSIPHQRKWLFVPTAQDGMVAVFEDFLDGTDLGLVVQFGAVGFGAVGVRSTPHNTKQIAPGWWSGTYGDRKFSEIRVDPSTERGFEVRVMRLLTDDGRRWDLDAFEPPWHAVWDPGARRVVDRFSHEHLVASAASLGLRPFDEDFYVPGGAVLLEQVRETFEGEKWGTFAMAQGLEPRVLRSYLTDPPPSPWRR